MRKRLSGVGGGWWAIGPALLLGASVLVGSAQVGTGGDPVSLESLLLEMADLDRLTVAPDPHYTTATASSYDRASVDPDQPGWFANTDRDNYIRVEQNQGRTEYVMMDAAGPGVVTRIWVANPSIKTVRFYLDGATEPTIEAPLKDLLKGNVEPFFFPLAHRSELGYNLYFPIPYAESCKITVEPPQSWFFYDVSYRTYDAATTVESFRMADAQSLRREIREAVRALAREPLGGALADSTANRIDGQLVDDDGDSEVDATGRIGGAVDLDGDADHVDLGNPAELPDGASPRSLCAWARAETIPTGSRWIASFGSPHVGQAMFVGMIGDALVGGGYSNDISSAGFWDTDDWHHVCLTYDGTTARLYGDGQLLQTSPRGWALERESAYIGAQVHGGEVWEGPIDEVRIVGTALSKEWIGTAHANQSDPSTFYSVGPEEPSPLPGWNHRKRISLDADRVVGILPLHDFPLLISLIDPDLRSIFEGGKVWRVDGDDIMVTLPDDATRLDCQIEHYDPTTGELVLWAEVPAINAILDTPLDLHYGHPAGGLQDVDPAEVWNSDYVGVWHLDAAPDDPLSNADHRSGQLVANAGPLTLTPLPNVTPQAVVRELRLRPSVIDEETLRTTLLEITFDGQTTVRAPLGDFFGSGPGLNPYESLPMSVEPDGTLISRWPMPFQATATFELSSASGAPLTVEYDVFLEPRAWSAGSLYFHAGWRADHEIYAHPDRDWTFLTVQGGGRYVGNLLNAVNPFVDLWWGEGDPKIWVDDESFPGHFGTGTEDHFGYAFGGIAQPFEHPYHDLTRVGEYRGHGRVSINRWHVFDAVPFASSLQVDIEQIFPATDDKSVVWDGAGYWYATPGATSDLDSLGVEELSLPEVPALLEKNLCGIVVEGESMEVLSTTGNVIDQLMSVLETDDRLWSDHHQAFARDGMPADRFAFGFDVEQADGYRVLAYLTRAADYGIFQPYINGQIAGPPIDLFGADGAEPTEGIDLGSFLLPSGPNTLDFEVLGQNPGNPHPDRFYLGVDALSLLRGEAVVVPVLTVERDRLSWIGAPTSAGFDVIRGDAGILVDTGDFGQAVDLCVANDHQDSSLSYTDSPADGQTFFFLVRDICIGTYDEQIGQLESRDASINSSPHACP